jgi:hypothetical protein
MKALHMNFQDDSKEYCAGDAPGFVIRCHKCGRAVPLLHPHIMLERTDEDDNLICEQCYEEHCSSMKPG